MNTSPGEIRFLLDQGVPRDAAMLLRAAGFTCEHAGELGLSRAEDPRILEAARERNAIVVTLDADFHAILAVSLAAGPSVIRFRIQGLNGGAVARLVVDVAGQFAAELQRGCLLTVKPRKVTCHKLPVAGRE